MSSRGGRRRGWGVKHILLMIAVVMGQPVLAADKKPLIADPIVEKAIREELKKPEVADRISHDFIAFFTSRRARCTRQRDERCLGGHPPPVR